MQIEDFTTEELRTELKRRDQEARRQRALERKLKGVEYAHAEVRITYVSDDPWSRRKFRIEFLNPELGKHISSISDIPIDRRVFSKKTSPQKGDIVKVRCRKTNYNPTGFGHCCSPCICEVIKRNENDKNSSDLKGWE